MRRFMFAVSIAVFTLFGFMTTTFGDVLIKEVITREFSIQIGRTGPDEIKEVTSREASIFVSSFGDAPFGQCLSREMSFAVVSNAPPSPITDLTVDLSPTGETVTLDWSSYNQWAERDIAHFDIYYTAQGPFVTIPAEGLTKVSVPAESTTKTIENLPAFTDHYFAVVSVDALGNHYTNVTYSAGYVLSPEVISREVSLFIGEDVSPHNQVISREVSVVVTSDLPPAPIADLTVNLSPTGETVTIDWSDYNQWAERDITRFDIYYTAQGPFVTVPAEGLTKVNVPAGSTAITFDNLPAFTDHYFAVVPVDALEKYYTNVTYSAGYVLSPEVFSREVSLFIGEDVSPHNQVISREISILNPDSKVPEQITGIDSGFSVQTSRDMYSAVDMDWSNYNEHAQNDVVRYNIYYNPEYFDSIDGMTAFASVPAGIQQYVLAGLPCDEIIFLAVVAEDSLGYSDSTVHSTIAKVSICGVDEVANLSVESGKNSMTYTWNPPPEAGTFLSNYHIYFAGSSTPVKLASDQTSWTATDLLPATGYHFNIKTVDIFGHESDGTSIFGATHLPNPINLTITGSGSNAVLFWDSVEPSSLVHYYAIYESQNPIDNVSELLPIKKPTSTSITLGSIESVTDQYFAVAAVNISGGYDPNVVSILATKQAQTINFSTITLGSREIPLIAEASSGLAVKFSSSPAYVATVEGTTLVVYQGGNLSVSAIQDGNEKFWPKTVTQTLRIPPVFESISTNGTKLNDGFIFTRSVVTVEVDARDADGIATAEFYGRIPGSEWELMTLDNTPDDGLKGIIPVATLPDGNYELHIVVKSTTGNTSEQYYAGRLALEAILSITLETELIEGNTLTGQVLIQRPRPEDLIVSINSSRPGIVDDGGPVSILAGQVSANFSIDALQNNNISAPIDVIIQASAAGAASTESVLTIVDDDWPTLTLLVNRTAISETGDLAVVQARIERTPILPELLTVNIIHSNPDVLKVPSQITIPAGQAYQEFLMEAIDDDIMDGLQTVDIRAEASLYGHGTIATSNTVTLNIGDNEGPRLEVIFDQGFIREGQASNLIIRRVGGPVDVNLNVILDTSDISEIQIPVSVTIPALSEEVTAVVQGIDDQLADGTQTALITGTADGYAPGQATVIVTEESLPDLTVKELTLPQATETESEFQISYSIENKGDGLATGPFTQRVFLSSDPFPGDDILLRQIEFSGNLHPGVTFKRDLMIRAPRKSGLYWLIVVTDTENTVMEALESNNIGFFAHPIQVDAAYSVTVTANDRLVPANTPIIFSGKAIKNNGDMAASVMVNIHIRTAGTERIIAALTDSNGNFSTSWKPLPDEGGRYEVGAAHPGVSSAQTQDSFVILTIATQFNNTSITLVEGEIANISGQLSNPNDQDLTGLSVETLNVPSGIDVQATLTTDTLLPNEEVAVEIQLSAATGFAGKYSITLQVTTDQEIQVNIPFTLSVKQLHPKLVITPNPLKCSVLRGSQKLVNFIIENIGGAESGPINILLPDNSWISMNSPSPLPSISPQTSISVSLLLIPEISEDLTLYNGNLVAVSENGNSINIPYEFRIVSDLKGDLEIEVVDEYFFFTDDAPKLEGATVTLRDAINSELISSVKTDADGLVRLEDVIEGWYLLEVDSPKHTPFKGNFYVSAGETTHRQVFISRELVTYTWTVEEIQIDDRYRISVESTFETNVPAPVVTVEPACLDVSDLNALGQTKIVNLKIENHGLINAEHGKFNFGSHPFYEIKPLISDLGTIPAKSTITIPVTITRIGVFANDGSIQTLTDLDRRRSSNTSVSCGISAGLSWDYDCGKSSVNKNTPIAVSGVQGYCPGGGGVFIPHGSGATGSGASPPVPITFSTPTFCDCPLFDELCLVGSKKIDIEAIANTLANTLSAVLPPWLKVDDVESSLQADGKLCICCQDGTISLSGDGTAKMLISVQLVVGFSGGFEVKIDDDKWNEISASVSALAGARIEANGEVSIKVNKPCLDEKGSICVTGSIGVGAFAGVELDVEASATLSHTNIEYKGTARAALGIKGSASASVTGCMDGKIRYQACGSIEPEATLVIKMTAPGHQDEVLGGSLELPKGEIGNCSQSSKRYFTNDNKVRSASPQLPYDFEVPGSEYLKSDQEIIASEFPELLKTADGICARVKIRLDQDAVMTRSAFRATFELVNKMQNAPLMDVGFDLQTLNEDGQPANDVFNIQVTSIDGLETIDGTGTIDPMKTGTAVWTLIPRDSAAPENDTVYAIGGTIFYIQDGTAFNIPVLPVSITVKPDAALSLKYFHQRDVFSDDPHTDITEPMIPYALAVMIQNNGAGAARNLNITTAQPKIVDNEKGLFIDFQVIGTEVAGQNLTPSLTASFGNIEPGEQKIATWLLTSTLQGLFIDYDATFEHLDGFGDPRLSLIKNVEIHEMRHMIEATGDKADGLPDFLVNDVPDIDDLPDTIHLSDGTTEPVSVYTSAYAAGSLSEDNLSVALDVTLNSGWSYIMIPDPGDASFRLVRVTRSDGIEIPLDKNVWVTDRTFLELGQRPIYENKLHLIDYDSTGHYTLDYEPVFVDVIPPESHVERLAESSSAQIPVFWTGTDDASISYFDIYVSINGGSFSHWLEKTKLNSAIYTGEFGKSYAFYSRATDTSGNTEDSPETADTTTVINIENASPVLNEIGNQVINEGDTLMLTISAIDQDGPESALRYSIDTDATGLIINPVSGEISWKTSEMEGGRMLTATVTVADAGSPMMIDSEKITITINELNDPPILRSATVEMPQNTALLPLTIQGYESIILDFDATDPDYPAQNLTFSLSDTAPAGANIDASTGIFSWIPTESQLGQTYTIQVQVSDDGINPSSLNDTISIVATVLQENIYEDPNVPPVTDGMSVTTNEDISLSLQLIAEDDDGDSLTYVIVDQPQHGIITGEGANVTYVPKANYSGSDYFRFKTNDSYFDSNISTVNITIISIADAPVLNLLPTTQGYEDTEIPISVSTVLSDTDESEILSPLIIWNVPEQAALSQGIRNSDGSYALTIDQFSGLSLIPTLHNSDDITLTMQVTAIETANSNSSTITKSIHIDIIPVADKPELTVIPQAAGNEDTTIQLTISPPSLVDKDQSEILSDITIFNIPDHVVLSDGTQNADGSWTLTSEQLSSLSLTPGQHIADDFTFTVSVTAAETENSDSATTTQTISVDIIPVADKPILVVSADTAGNEDTAIQLTIEEPSLIDQDQSEILSNITLSNVPEHAILSAGTKNFDGTWTLTSTQLPSLSITPGKHIADDFTITVNITAAELENSDSATTTQTISVDIIPVADKPTLVVTPDTSGKEDTAIPLTIELPSLVDKDQSEILSDITLFHIPDHVVLSSGIKNDDSTWTLTLNQLVSLTLTPGEHIADDFTLTVSIAATETENSDSATTTQTISVDIIPVADKPTLVVTPNASGDEDTEIQLSISPPSLMDQDYSEELSDITLSQIPDHVVLSAGTKNADGTWILSSDQLSSLTLTPGKHIADDFNFTVSVTATETENNDSAIATQIISVDIIPVADKPTLVVIPNTSGNEDSAIQLSISPPSLIDLDQSEILSNITISQIPDHVVLSAGTKNADGSWTLTSKQLTSLMLTPGQHIADDFTLTVSVSATETENNVFATTTQTISVDIIPIADIPTLVVTQNVFGNEDTPIQLTIEQPLLIDQDQSEVLSDITLSQLPDHVVLSAGRKNLNGTWTLTSEQLSSLSLTPGKHVSDDFIFEVSVTATETENSDSARAKQTISVDIIPIADKPTFVVTPNASGNEDTPIQLTIEQPFLIDQDQSEVLSDIVFSQIPDHAVLSAGTKKADGSWTLTSEQLSSLCLTPGKHIADDFTLTVSVTATETENSYSATATQTISVDIIPVADKPTLVVTPNSVGNEDTAIPLSIEQPLLIDQDHSEVLSDILFSQIPDHAVLSAGTKNADGTWTLTKEQLPSLTITPGPNETNDFILIISVTATETENSNSATTTQTITVNIIPVNDLPTISKINDQETNENTPTSPIGFTIGDIETDLEKLILSVNSSNTELISKSCIVLSGIGMDRFIVLSPKPGQYGLSTISISVKDEFNGLSETSFVLTVQNVVRPGDFNDNGLIELIDSQIALNILAGINSSAFYIEADVNGNKKVDLHDVIYIQQYLNNLPGIHDPNNDKNVDLKDVVILLQYLTDMNNKSIYPEVYHDVVLSIEQVIYILNQVK